MCKCISKFAYIVFVVLIAVPASALATEFPTGKFEGVGFKIVRGSMVITHNDLSLYESSATVEKIGEDKIRMTVEAKMQRTVGTRIKNDKRVDSYNVVWTDDNKGKLINTSSTYKNDRTTFKVDGDRLEIVSWIARNKLTETHLYKILD